MTDNDWAIQVSPRVGDTLINLRAKTGDEMLGILSWYEQNSATIASALGTGAAGAAVGQTFAGPGTQNVPQQQGSWSDQGSQQAPPAFVPQQAAPQGGGAPAPSCTHGPMVFRSGNKNGRDWKAYFCPTPRGTQGQCDPQFIR